ncbi:MAG: HAD family phosphatase [Spirochaetes bacterium]|nr:HAD family phosphatase [Spirochaetota bacterium]
MKAIILDMDGLMIDSERLYFETETEIVKKYNRSIDKEILTRLMGRSPLEAAKILIKEINLALSPEEFIKKRDEAMEYKYKHEAEPVNGLMSLLKMFYNKFKLAVATGSPQKFLDIVVDRLKIRHYFDVLQSSDHIKKGKPDPEIYLTVCNKLNFKPSECIVLEDSSNGALAGKKAGCYTIAVYTEYTKNQDFSFVDHYSMDLSDSIEHIKSIIEYKNKVKI